jgi:hypothetical protein
MPIRIKITQKGKPLKQIMPDFLQKIELTKAEVRQLGIETQEKFRQLIKASKKRPGGGNLESKIQVEYFVDGVSWGVGNIDLLDKEAPYWKALNWGSSHAVGKVVGGGIFEPGNPKPNAGSFRQGRFVKGASDSEGKQYAFTVKRPIKAINFLERTVFWFKNRILNITRNLGR